MFLLPKKWTKVHQNPLRFATHQWPLLCQISSRSAKRCTTKSVTKSFKTLGYFGAQGDLLGQSSPISVLMYSTNNLPNFVSFYDNLSRRYLQRNFVDFVESVTDRSTKTLNDMSPHTVWRQKDHEMNTVVCILTHLYYY